MTQERKKSVKIDNKDKNKKTDNIDVVETPNVINDKPNNIIKNNVIDVNDVVKNVTQNINEEIDRMIEESNKQNIKLRNQHNNVDSTTMDNIKSSIKYEDTKKQNETTFEEVKPKNIDNHLFNKSEYSNNIIKENKIIYNNYVNDLTSEFEIYFRGNKIFDSATSKRDNIKFENEYFIIFGKKMLYNGTLIIQKSKV